MSPRRATHSPDVANGLKGLVDGALLADTFDTSVVSFADGVASFTMNRTDGTLFRPG
jgi:hypothetical protein